MESILLSVTQDSLHEQISLIPQDPSLFHRSLKENIGYGKPDADDFDIITAAQMAHADDFIQDMAGRIRAHWWENAESNCLAASANVSPSPE